MIAKGIGIVNISTWNLPAWTGRSIRQMLLCLSFGSSICTLGQALEKVDMLTFGDVNPIKVEPTRVADKFTFVVVNESFFPYEVEVKFTEFINLRPRVAVQKITASSGRTTLCNLTVVDQDVAPRFAYTTRFHVSPKLATTVDEKFPYLVPLKPGNTVRAFDTNDDGLVKEGFFKMTDGETVCAIRKGVVTATPEFALNGHRLTQNSVEILHPDGSVAIYSNLDRSMCKYGDQVLPGQPVGISTSTMPLRVRVFHFTESQCFIQFNHVYATANSETIPSNQLKDGWTVVHPVPVILRELSKREAKRLVP